MGQLKPLSQIMPQQPVQQQPQQQYQQPVQQQPQQQYQQPVQQQAQSNTQAFPLQSTAQLDQMRNNGRVELVVQDATSGYQVISTDQLNIANVEAQNPALAQELRMFDSNRDGWLVEQELQATVTSTPVASSEKVSTFEHVASSTLGGGMFGGAVGGLASKMGLNIGSKFGVKGWVAGAVAGAAVGLVGGFITNKSNEQSQQQQDYNNAYGYRPETQWNNNRLVKTIL